jgi:nicotinamidase/pyrazinamidase
VVRKGEHGEDGYSGFTMRDPVSGSTVRPRWPTACARRAHDAWSCSAWPRLLRARDALDGRELGWPVTVPWAAVRAVDLEPGDGERARDELLAAGVEIV